MQLAQPSTVFSTVIIPQLFPTFLLKLILRLRQTGIQKTCTTLMRVTENHLIWLIDVWNLCLLYAMWNISTSLRLVVSLRLVGHFRMLTVMNDLTVDYSNTLARYFVEQIFQKSLTNLSKVHSRHTEVKSKFEHIIWGKSKLHDKQL